ncbi:MAG: N-6 DNA methylase [Phycisphaerae bacterium]|nr:N-6 DNA methylase [Phycisphaerae bacterium]MDD5380636.1 N-6 DNA methylase [Phycisphaerae bacterium]
MANSLLEFGAILPPLLEQQISPPYRIVARHLAYLQKWREYLLWMWTGDTDKNTDKTNVQRSVDEFLSTILLIDFVGRSYPTMIPTVEEVLKIIKKPTAFDLCEAVYNQVSCKLLKAVFSPNSLIGPMIEPLKNVELSSLNNISEVVETLYGSRILITLLGDFHQLCLEYPVADKTVCKKSSGRHGKGIYYTPAALVDYIAFHTLRKVFHKLAPEQIKYLRIFDPSCGYGVFLIASFRFILEWFRTSSRLSLQESLELLESMIHGIDIDECAVHWTHKLLLLTVLDFYIHKGISNDDIRNLKIPNLVENIICRDFLEEQPLKNEAYHIIIGGPPFVRVQELYKSDAVKVNSYKRSYETAKEGQFDLYMLFIERAIKLLVDQGHLSMSVSNTFLRSGSGRALRKLITDKCAIREIIEFEDNKLYPNASAQIAAIMLQKTTKRNTTRHVFVKGRGGLRRKLSGIGKQDGNAFLQIRELSATACASEDWSLKSESEANLLGKIESVGIQLGKLPISIRFGTATGADKVFLLKNVDHLDSKKVLAESRFLDDIFVLESSILRPVLRGRHIREYTTPKPKTLCIFPYDEAGNLIAEDELRVKFPCTYRYLKCCQSYLRSRKLKHNQPWYAFRSEHVSDVTRSPKIIASAVNSGGGFALDQGQHLFCNNSVILIRPDEKIVNPYFLLAVLNSKVFWTWAQHRMPTLGSGWRSYRVSTLRNFPIPTLLHSQYNQLFKDVVDLAAKLLNEKLNERDRISTLSSIDNIVSYLYGIKTKNY